MSYRCNQCNEVYFGPELKHTVSIRPVTYNKCVFKFDRESGKKRPVLLETFTGTEIEQEKHYCPKCFEVVKDTPAVLAKQKIVTFFIKEKREFNRSRRPSFDDETSDKREAPKERHDRRDKIKYGSNSD